MTSVIIPQGKVWAVRESLQRLPAKVARHMLYAGPTLQRGYVYRVVLPRLPQGVGFKLCGLSYFPYTCYRVKRYGRGELMNISHENSDRFVMQSNGDRYMVMRYAYRRGLGGISTHEEKRELTYKHGPLSSLMALVRPGEEVTLSLQVRDKYATYTVGAPSMREEIVHKVPFLDAPRRPFFKEFSHADNGSRQPAAPTDIRFRFAFDNV